MCKELDIDVRENARV